MVERQGWGEIKEGLGAPLRKLLEERSGAPTIVRMANADEIEVYQVAWGRDHGDMWENIHAYCSLEAGEGEVHFLYLSEIESLWDPATGALLMEQVPAPGET